MKDKPNSSKTTVILKPLHPERSILGQKKKCRDQKKESESCLKLLNKCNSRVFRATHAGELSSSWKLMNGLPT